MEVFLYANIERMVDGFVNEVSNVLDNIKVLGSNSQGEGLEPMVPVECLAKVVRATVSKQMSAKVVVDWDDERLADKTEFLQRVRIPTHAALAPLLHLADVCSEHQINTTLIAGETSAELSKLVPCLKLYGAVADMLFVTSALAHQALGEKPQIVMKVKNKGVTSYQVSPVVSMCLDWVVADCGLNWAAARSHFEESAGEHRFKYNVVDLSRVVGYISASWLPFARYSGLRCTFPVIESMAKQLSAKTPQYSQIRTNSRYNSALAKKQLVTAPVEQIAKFIDQLELFMKDVVNDF